tara:strand:- start:297 stop:515 length:219 start_codon:yes stop_codon:yes gene_type:complete
MKFLISWLKEYVSINESPEELSDLLSLNALETEVVSKDKIDVEVTPNRSDCLSHQGLAREIEAIKKSKNAKE